MLNAQKVVNEDQKELFCIYKEPHGSRTSTSIQRNCV